jgi:hypothetical protein
LSSTKCGLNVENFLSACRRLGVGERDLCAADDILEELRPVKVTSTVKTLLDLTRLLVLQEKQNPKGSKPIPVLSECGSKPLKTELSFQDHLISYLCLAIFVLSVVILFVYPIETTVA